MPSLEKTCEYDLVITKFEKELRKAKTSDDRAKVFLTLGVRSEHFKEWEYAIKSYSRALLQNPDSRDLLYFGNNNLAYSLIQLGRHDEAEKYCLTAIDIIPSRHNAHKNLGLVRQEQKNWEEAAFCFLLAFQLCPNDQRSWHLLTALISSHPKLLEGSEGFQKQFADLAEYVPAEMIKAN